MDTVIDSNADADTDMDADNTPTANASPDVDADTNMDIDKTPTRPTSKSDDDVAPTDDSTSNDKDMDTDNTSTANASASPDVDIDTNMDIDKPTVTKPIPEKNDNTNPTTNSTPNNNDNTTPSTGHTADNNTTSNGTTTTAAAVNPETGTQEGPTKTEIRLKPTISLRISHILNTIGFEAPRIHQWCTCIISLLEPDPEKRMVTAGELAELLKPDMELGTGGSGGVAYADEIRRLDETRVLENWFYERRRRR